jgi:hypothetical protein
MEPRVAQNSACQQPPTVRRPPQGHWPGFDDRLGGGGGGGPDPLLQKVGGWWSGGPPASTCATTRSSNLPLAAVGGGLFTKHKEGWSNDDSLYVSGFFLPPGGGALPTPPSCAGQFGRGQLPRGGVGTQALLGPGLPAHPPTRGGGGILS